MKVLTLTQPWAMLVVKGYKRFETRSWQPDQRLWPCPLAIHAAKGWTAEDRQYARELGFDPDALPRGAVVGEVILQGVFRTEQARRFVGVAEERMGDYSSGRYAWELIAPQEYAEPVPARGRLGLWEWEGDRS